MSCSTGTSKGDIARDTWGRKDRGREAHSGHDGIQNCKEYEEYEEYEKHEELEDRGEPLFIPLATAATASRRVIFDQRATKGAFETCYVFQGKRG